MNTLTTEEIDTLIDEHFAYECADDVDGVVSTLIEDAEHDVVGSPMGKLRGRDEARAFYERLYADLDGHSVTTLKRYYGDGFVVDESLWDGVAIGTPLGIPGHGKPIKFRILHVFEIAPGGGIARENVWMDYPAIIQQLTDPSDGQRTDVSDQNRSLVLQMYDAFDRGALEDFDAVAPGFTARVVARAEPFGWDEFKQFGTGFRTAFPDGRHIFERTLVEGDAVMTIGRYEGTHEGDLMGMTPTGRRISMPVMHLDRVVDGKIVEHRGLGDLNLMMEQLTSSSG